MNNQQDASEGVTLDELDIMAERLGRCVPFGNYVDCHDVLGFAFTGLPPGPARNAALADLLARLGRPADRQGDGAVQSSLPPIEKWGDPHLRPTGKQIVDDAVREFGARLDAATANCAPTPPAPAGLVEAARIAPDTGKPRTCPNCGSTRIVLDGYADMDGNKADACDDCSAMLPTATPAALDAALSAQAGAAPGVVELPSVEALARALSETDVTSGSVASWDRLLEWEADDQVPRPAAHIATIVLRNYRARATKIRARLASQPGGEPVAAGKSDGELRKAVRAVVVAYDRDELAYKSPRLISALRAALGASSGGEG